MGFRLVPKSVTSNDLERPNGPYFPLFHRIWQLLEPITSKWLEIDYIVCNRSVAQRI